MKPVKLCTEAQAVFDRWTGKEGQVLHIWEQDETYFIVMNYGKSHLKNVYAQDVYFIRMFPIGGRWQISEDRHLKMTEVTRF